jgi:tetratricopeptide (TPR) repeat protein
MDLNFETHEIKAETSSVMQRKNIKSILAMSGFLILAFIHIVNWDRHSFAIVPLKMKQILGMASPSDLRNISDICTERMKYDCVDSALSELMASEGRPEDFLRLGDLRRKLGQHKSAISAYETALTLHPVTAADNSLLADANFGMAKSYEAIGQIDQAASHYETAIVAKPEVIQITVTQAYLNMLKVAGRSDLAQKVVEEARKRSHSDRLFSEAL